MYYPTFAAMGWAMFAFWLLGVFVFIAWILMPFAMFGIKPLLRDLVAATKETNRLLAAAQASPPALVAEKSPPGP
jgi:hypothetical protein